MSQSIEEKIELETWELLQQLKQDYLLTPEDRYVVYEVDGGPDVKGYPSEDNQRKIIYKLEHLGIMTIIKKRYVNARGSLLDSANMHFELKGAKPKGFLLDIVSDKFSKMFNEYSKKYSEKTNYEPELYIEKRGDDFYYKGRLLSLSKNNDYYKVFCSLYVLLPTGGEIGYKEIEKEITTRIKKTKQYTPQKMRKFLLTNLTDQNNGFLHYAEIPKTEDNGKPLISVVRGKSIIFNNKQG